MPFLHCIKVECSGTNNFKVKIFNGPHKDKTKATYLIKILAKLVILRKTFPKTLSGKASLTWNNNFTIFQLTVTCSKSTIETLEKSVKYVQS